jgi:hypothetical protein
LYQPGACKGGDNSCEERLSGVRGGDNLPALACQLSILPALRCLFQQQLLSLTAILLYKVYPVHLKPP